MTEIHVRDHHKIAPGAIGIGILLGSTRVFDAADLARRYPAGPGEYAAAFRWC